MMKLAGVLLGIPLAAGAAPWTFSAPVTVSEPAEGVVYHHLDGAGRRHLAVSGGSIALVWEDDRDGSPRVYAATMPLDGEQFGPAIPLGRGAESYAPSIAPLPGGRWVTAWEQDGGIHAAVLETGRAGAETQLSSDPARQVNLASTADGRALATWARRTGRDQVLVFSELSFGDGNVSATLPATVTAPGTSGYQGFPDAAWLADGALLVTWEDRRAGHTRLYASRRSAGGLFGREVQLNEHNEAVATEDYLANKGSGAMRVSVAADPGGAVRAVWLDKRNPGSGYAVWGASSADGGRSFGANERVQDTMGDAVAQWHASVAHGPGGFVAAWDDARENWSDETESGDVVISWQTPTGWSEDLIVPGASGPGYQGSPVIALDASGALHLVFIESDVPGEPTHLRYLRGTPSG